MSIELLSLTILVMLLVLIGLGVPVAYATGATAVILGSTLFGPDSLILIPDKIYELLNNYALLAVPLFILMGLLLEKSGVPDVIMSAMQAVTSKVPGGLAVGTVFAATIMAAMVGVIGAEIVALGLVALPAMLRLGYERKLALGVICAGGSLGSLIPPSVVLVLYGVLANVSVTKLFVAAVVPGLIYAGLYCSYVVVRCMLNPALAPAVAPLQGTRDGRAPAGAQAGKAIGALALAAVTVALMMGSLYLGIATPTEVAALGVVLALVLAWLRGRLDRALLAGAAQGTSRSLGTVLMVFFGANALISYYNFAGGTTYLNELIVNLPLPPMGIIALMMAIWFLMGFIVDFFAILLLTVPIFLPIVKDLGFDPIWFGILFCMNMQMSYLTPPMGPAVFYLKSVTPPEITVEEIFQSIWPFVLLQALGLALIVSFPDLALWLPGLSK